MGGFIVCPLALVKSFLGFFLPAGTDQVEMKFGERRDTLRWILTCFFFKKNPHVEGAARRLKFLATSNLRLERLCLNFW
jgi:hypothetical protein